MRMKCLFCHEPCFLLRDGEPDYEPYDMYWVCRNHKEVDIVRHRVSCRQKCVRDNRSLRGVTREWEHTLVQWKNSNGFIYRAYYQRDENEEPCGFILTIEDPNSPEDEWRRRKTAIDLDDYPDWVPENIQSKVRTFLVFS